MTELKPIYYVMFEDSVPAQDSAKRKLANLGWVCLAVLSTFDDAKEFIKSSTFPDTINAALVDGNLSPDEDDGYEGEQLIKLIREQRPDVITIAFSSIVTWTLGAHLPFGKINLFETDAMQDLDKEVRNRVRG